MKKSTFSLLIAGGIAAAATASVAQTDKMAPMGRGEATIYRDTNFSGPAVFVGEAKTNLALRWSVNSIRVKSGTWELCARTRYRSPCITVSADEPNIRRFAPQMMMVQSMRPLGYAPPVIEHPAAGTSLRGMAAEFFPAPGNSNGRRVLACGYGSASANCAAETADSYCKSIGWAGSARQSMETVNSRVYLADVLCTRTGY